MIVRDLVGAAGFLMIGAGTFHRFGWDVAVIIGGTILLALAIIGAMRG